MIRTIFIFMFLFFLANNALGQKVFESVSFESSIIENINSGSFYNYKNDETDFKSPLEKYDVIFISASGLDDKEVPSSSISYAEWAAIVLTCVAVLVTVLGVLIALLSFWGFRNIAKEARSISEKTASNMTKKQVENCINDIAKVELAKLIREGELREPLENAVDIIFRAQDFSNGFSEFPELDEDSILEGGRDDKGF